jgi:hypothetical protein
VFGLAFGFQMMVSVLVCLSCHSHNQFILYHREERQRLREQAREDLNAKAAEEQSEMGRVRSEKRDSQELVSCSRNIGVLRSRSARVWFISFPTKPFTHTTIHQKLMEEESEIARKREEAVDEVGALTPSFVISLLATHALLSCPFFIAHFLFLLIP